MVTGLAVGATHTSRTRQRGDPLERPWPLRSTSLAGASGWYSPRIPVRAGQWHDNGPVTSL